jgi:hypothetical protein
MMQRIIDIVEKKQRQVITDALIKAGLHDKIAAAFPESLAVLIDEITCQSRDLIIDVVYFSTGKHPDAELVCRKSQAAGQRKTCNDCGGTGFLVSMDGIIDCELCSGKGVTT